MQRSSGWPVAGRQWDDSAVKNFDELRTRELEKLNYIEREGWAGWNRIVESKR